MRDEEITALISAHGDGVRTYVRKTVRDAQLAEDLYQDSILKAIEALRAGGYSEEEKFRGWMARIAHNLIVDHFRKSGRLPECGKVSDLPDWALVEHPHETSVVTAQVYAGLRRLVNMLPEEQREVVELRYYVELSFKEIAEVTGVSINTALGRMRYALSSIRRMIERESIKIDV